MRNITVSVGEETYRLSRVKAAEAGTSVSALVRAYLIDLVEGRVPDKRFDRLRSLQGETLGAIRARGGGLRATDNVSRQSLHERDALLVCRWCQRGSQRANRMAPVGHDRLTTR